MVLVRPTPPPVAVPSTQNRQNVVGHFGPAAVLRGLGGGYDGRAPQTSQAAPYGRRDTAETAQDQSYTLAGLKWRQN